MSEKSPDPVEENLVKIEDKEEDEKIVYVEKPKLLKNDRNSAFLIAMILNFFVNF